MFWRRRQVRVVIRGMVGRTLVRWQGTLSVPDGATLAEVLRRAGRACGADLAHDARHRNPVLMLNGDRLDLPEALDQPVPAGAELVWLMPLTGGLL